MDNVNFENINENELIYIDAGSFWKYVGAAGSIGFGIYEISTGVGVPDGTRRIFVGGCGIAGGLYEFLN